MSEALLVPANGGLARLWGALHPLPEVAVDVPALRADAYADGLAAGRVEAEAATAAAREALHRAAAALTAASIIDPVALTPVFTALTRRLCEAALRAELRLSPDALTPLVTAALAAADCHRPAVLRVHPDVHVCLELAETLPRGNDGSIVGGITLIADPNLAPDEIIVDGPAYRLETSLAARLAAMVEAL